MKAIRMSVLVVMLAAAIATWSGKALVGLAAGQVESTPEAGSLDDAFVGKNPQAVVAEMREIWLKAEAGDLGALLVFPEAMTDEVGDLALFGPPDLENIQESAAQGKPWGLVRLAERYRDGEGVEQDLGAARRLYREAAEKGHPGGHVGLGQLYFKGDGVPQSSEKAFEHYRLAAEGRVAGARRRLGEWYRDGVGVEASDEEAVKWYRLAARQGDAESCLALADLLFEGRAGDMDSAELAKCLSEEAGWGRVEAQWKLGLLYARGAELDEGDVPSDWSQAEWSESCREQSLEWFRQAATQGHEEAARRVAEHYVEVEAQLAHYKTLSSWPGRLPDLDDAAVLNNIGVWLAKRDGGRENIEWALGKARALGDPRAELNLGLLDLDHEAGDQRLVDGIRHLRNAAAKGLPEAMNELGVCYATGWGVEKDPAEAEAWFRKAAAAGNVDAQFNLGIVFLRGNGVEQDYRQAYEWLAQAASAGDPITAAMRDKVGELLGAESSVRTKT
jgi:TPR repeat protein